MKFFRFPLGHLLTILIHQIAAQHREQMICNGKCVCLPNENVISCHDSDKIRALPTNIERTFTRLIIQKGRFDIPTLFGYNLTGLEHLTFLKIIYSNLQFIDAKAFINMHQLQYLDLSHNKIVRLPPMAFTSISLLELHIMDNPNIQFDNAAFTGMTSNVINLRNNNITNLDFDLFQNTSVKQLYLYNNQIEKIDPRFQELFNRSDTLLDVSDNPLICDCSLSWLAEFLSGQFSKEKSLINVKRINIRCKSPKNLYNRELMTLKPGDLGCLPLRIHEIRLSIAESTAQVSCLSKVGGYKTPDVQWIHHSPSDEKVLIKGVTTRSTESSEVSYEQNSLSLNTINLTKLFSYTDTTRLICLASVDDDVFEKLEVHLYRLKRLLIRNTTTDIVELPVSNGFLFEKHFSILELLAAIFGTFSTTFVGLLIFLRYIKSYHDRLLEKDGGHNTHHKNTNSIRPYWSFFNGHSSTYSVPHSHFEYEVPPGMDIRSEANSIYLTQPYGGIKFIDFKTHVSLDK